VPEPIRAKFQLTKTRLYITAKYHDVLLSMSWPVSTQDQDAIQRQINTMILHLPELVKNGREEASVRREVMGLDAEYERLFREEEQ
jgi:hypothetical protein